MCVLKMPKRKGGKPASLSTLLNEPNKIIVYLLAIAVFPLTYAISAGRLIALTLSLAMIVVNDFASASFMFLMSYWSNNC